MIHLREPYLQQLAPFIQKPIIKVITGLRRVGKSHLLKQIIHRLTEQGIDQSHICYINKESLEFEAIRDHQDLHQYVKNEWGSLPGTKFLFVDEVQEIANWEKAIVSFFSQGDIDLYITGSNAHLLSSDLATLLSGRYIEFPLYTLGFEEFLTFRNATTEQVTDELQQYLQFGGLPGIHEFRFESEVLHQYIHAVYNTILLKDIVQRYNLRNVQLLENITRYVFDNIGNIFSSKKVSDYLKSQQLKVGVDTIQSYLGYLCATFILYRVPRYDIKGKRHLEIHEKYYLGDLGIRHALLGYQTQDIGGLLENLVFLELKRRGFQVSIGKLGNREIDFIAEKKGKPRYLQVAYLLTSQETLDRELTPLQQVPNQYPKYLLTMDTLVSDDFQGIQRLSILDFLLNAPPELH